MTLNDLNHVISIFFFDPRVTLGTPLVPDFQPSKYLHINCMSKNKNKKEHFSSDFCS